MELIFIVVENYAWLAAWLVTCLLPGIACWGLFTTPDRSPALTWPNPELALFFTICAGLALQILLLIVLAVSNLLSPVPIMLALAALMVGSLVSLRLYPANWNNFARAFHRPGSEWLRTLPLLLLILPWVLRPLGPPSGSDALTYHLPYARFYLDQGGLAVNEALRYPLHTHSINLIYAAALIRPGATLAQMIHAAMGLLALLGIYGMSRHWQGWITGFLSAAGVLLFEEFVRSFSYAYVDNGTLLFITAAFLSMALWSERGQSRLLWFCALFAGTAMGTKYQGAMFTIPLGLMVLWFSKDLKLTVKFALLTSIFGLFWYVRSWLISGNPVHPFAGELFGHYFWTANELAAQMRELKSHGVDKNLLNFLLLPERLCSAHMHFKEYAGNGGVLVGAFMLSCFLIPWQKPLVRALQVTCLAYLIYWFWSAQVIRYLLLVTPLMSLCAVTAFATLFAGLRNRQKANTPGSLFKTNRILEQLVLAITIVLLLWFGQQTLWMDRDKIPLNEQQQAEFLSRQLPAYDLMLAAAADPRIGMGPVMQFRIPEARYFFPGVVVGDWFGPYSYRKFGFFQSGYWEINDSETLYRQITEKGVKAVAMHKHPDIFWPQDIESYREHFEIVLETEDGVLMIPVQ